MVKIVYITIKAAIKADTAQQMEERIDALRQCTEGACKALPFVGHVSLVEQDKNGGL